MPGIIRVEPVGGGAHEKAAVRRALGEDVARQREAGGVFGRQVGDPGNVEGTFGERRIKWDLCNAVDFVAFSPGEISTPGKEMVPDRRVRYC